MTLEATCRPDAVWDVQVIPTIRSSVPAADEGSFVLDWWTTPFDSVEDAVASGCPLPCQDVDPDLFFAESPAEVEVAKALCIDCPVRAMCLTAAADRREPWGVWGGEWFVAGIAVPRKRPRGRPRKDGSVGPRPARHKVVAA